MLARDDGEIEAAASLLGKEQHGGLLIIPEPFTNAHRDQIIAQSARFRIPTINPVFGAANRGALISYTYAFDIMMRRPSPTLIEFCAENRRATFPFRLRPNMCSRSIWKWPRRSA